MVLKLADRFHVLPRQIHAEGTGLLRLVALEREMKAVTAGG